MFLDPKGSERDYQLWVNSGKEAAPYPLIGECWSQSKAAAWFLCSIISSLNVTLSRVYYELDNGIFSLGLLRTVVGKHIFSSWPFHFMSRSCQAFYRGFLPRERTVSTGIPLDDFVFQRLGLPVVIPAPALMTRLPLYRVLCVV